MIGNLKGVRFVPWQAALQYSWTVPFYLGLIKYWNLEYFFFFFSGVTTSILAPEQSPNICFDFFTLVFCLKHKCIWNHRGNELGDECCDNLL